MWSFVNHIKSIGKFKHIFLTVWPWNLMDDLEKQKGISSILCQALCIISNPSVYSNWSYSPERLSLVKIGDFFVPLYLEIKWITLKNNRASLLYYIKLCASFQSHEWIQSQVAVRKCPIWVQIDKFLPHVTLKFAGWLSKTKGHLTSPMLL